MMIAPHSIVWSPPDLGFGRLGATQSECEGTGFPRDSGDLGTEPDLDERVGSDQVDHLTDLRLRGLAARRQTAVVLRDRRAAEELTLLYQHRLCRPTLRYLARRAAHLVLRR